MMISSAVRCRTRLFLAAMVVCLTLVSGVAKAGAADEAMLASYTALWKYLLAESCGIPEADLKNLVQIKDAEISVWNSGKTFRVRYTVTQGWLTYENQDQFMVWINQKTPSYHKMGLPRDAWFTLPDVRIVFDKGVFDPSLAKIDPAVRPKFAHFQEAMSFVTKKYGLAQLDRVEVKYYPAGKMPGQSAAPFLVWFTVINDKENMSRKGWLNLLTGADESDEDRVRIYSGPDEGGGIVGP